MLYGLEPVFPEINESASLLFVGICISEPSHARRLKPLKSLISEERALNLSNREPKASDLIFARA